MFYFSALALLGDEDTHLTTLFVALIQQANSRAHEAVQHETAQRISDLFDSEAEECASTYRFMLCLTKKPSAVPKEELGTSTEDGGEHLQDDIMFRLLRAIEVLYSLLDFTFNILTDQIFLELCSVQNRKE
uniref:Uncharacterized protein n=1 Tax=Parascaris equorum TaxID=6256 RepID=A0A914R416_PAREQ